MEDEKRSKEQGQKVEISNEFGRYSSDYIIIGNQLNVDGPKTPVFSKWIKKCAPTICCLPEAHFKYKGTYRLKVDSLSKTSVLKQ